MEPEKLKEEMERKRKAGWLDVWMAFEAAAVNKETAENAMLNHMEKVEKTKDTIVYEKKLKGCVKVGKVPENIRRKLPAGAELWSQVAEAKALFKDLYTLLNVIMVYGPSAVEILAPKEYKMKTDEMQNIANIVAGLLHDFAGAGIGGLLVSGERK